MGVKHTLYQDPTCPFCQRVLGYLSQRGKEIPQKDTLGDFDAFRELIKGGGRATVPCLRIEAENGEVTWMYESSDIIAYLEEAL